MNTKNKLINYLSKSPRNNFYYRKEPMFCYDFNNKNKGWWNNKFKIDKYPNKNLTFNLEKNKGWWNNKKEIKRNTI